MAINLDDELVFQAGDLNLITFLEHFRIPEQPLVGLGIVDALRLVVPGKECARGTESGGPDRQFDRVDARDLS